MELQKNQSGQLAVSLNNISAIDRKAVENLLPGETKIIQAGLMPKISEQPAVDVVLMFNSIISTAYTRAGYKMPDEATLALYADEFYSSLIEKFPRVTIPEVKEALKEGVYGEYGEFTGLNPKTFIQFIKGYLFSKDRAEAIKQFESKRQYLKAQIELSPEQKEQFNKDFINDQYNDFRSGKLIADFIPSFLYEFLEQQGKIKLTIDEKRKIKDRAQSYFKRLKTSKRYKGNARSIGDELAAYVQGRDEDLTIKNISKQFAVFDFFEAQAKTGTETIFPKQKLLQ